MVDFPDPIGPTRNILPEITWLMAQLFIVKKTGSTDYSSIRFFILTEKAEFNNPCLP
uniref:Uncharacterized protein n=1 Tax=Methylophaga nitratireducenticrescens TaxID=754476 RepID=I1XEV0_METNJ